MSACARFARCLNASDSGRRLMGALHRFVFAMLLAGFAATTTQAATTYSWIGTSSTLWSDQNNWNPIGVPQSGDLLAFPAGAANRTNTNDLTPGTALTLAFNGGGYAIGGNQIVLNGLTDNNGNSLNVPIQIPASMTVSASTTLGGSVDLQGFTLNASGLQFNGVISGSGGITKLGSCSSQVVLRGANTYSGPTINADSNGCSYLVLYGSLPNSDVTLSYYSYTMLSGSIGTLAANGYLDLRSQSSGTVSVPTKSVSLGANSNTNFEINGPTAGTNYDQLQVTGTVTINSSANASFTLSNSFVPAVGQVFTLIDNDGTDPVSGTFNGRPEGFVITLNGVYQFQISCCTAATAMIRTSDRNVVRTPGRERSKFCGRAQGNWRVVLPASAARLTFRGQRPNRTTTNDSDAGAVLMLAVRS